MASALTLALPRFIALRSNERPNNYMGYVHEEENDEYGYLEFKETEAESPYVKFEVEPADKDGLVHVRSSRNNKYWERTKKGCDHWITATATKPENDQSKKSCTLFKPITVDSANNTIRIMHVQSGCYLCLWNSAKMYVMASFKVYDHHRFDIFQVIDWNSKRYINNVKYDLENSKVYDETQPVMANTIVTNNEQQEKTFEVKLPYTSMRTSTWNTMFSLNLEMKTNLDMSVPLIVNKNVEMSGEVQSGVKWGETTETATELEFPHNVVVPPMTKVTVYLVATNGKCDVPFTFTQDDTLYNWETVTTEVQGGTYTGSNYYNFHIETKKENI